MHSSAAISSARSSMASATRCSSFLRIVAGMSRQDLNACAAAVAAPSMSSALPRATVASTAPSTGDVVSNLSPEIDGTVWPPITWPMPSAFSLASRGAARSRLAWKVSFGVTLSMRSLHFQSFVDVVALPARLLVVDLHVERQRELAAGEHRIEIGRQRLEDVLAGLLAHWEIASLAEPQHHVEEAEMRTAVGNRKMLASDSAHPDAAEREDAGLDGRLADQFDDVGHVDALVEIGGIFNGEMRHGGSLQLFLFTSREVATHRAIGAIVGLDRVAFAGLDRAYERSRQHHLAGFQRQAVGRDLVGEPGYRRRGMVEHAGGKPGFFQLAVTIAQRADPAQVGIPGANRAAAKHDAGVGRIVGDGVKDLSGGFGLRVDPFDAGIEDFQRRHHEIGGIEHVEHRAAWPGEPLLHDKGKFRLHARGYEALGRHQPAICKEHIVEQDAGIRL